MIVQIFTLPRFYIYLSHFLPCHRVLSQKSLRGFALGLRAKRELLSIEQKSKRKAEF